MRVHKIDSEIERSPRTTGLESKKKKVKWSYVWWIWVGLHLYKCMFDDQKLLRIGIDSFICQQDDDGNKHCIINKIVL